MNDPGIATRLSGAPECAGWRREADFDAGLEIRRATPEDAPQIHALIAAHVESDRLLPRGFDELLARAGGFTVAVDGDLVAGCAELAPLSPLVAEVRSLVVHEDYRGGGVSARIVDALKRDGRREGFATLCAFTHQPAHFVRLGFSIVPHVWLPEKIATDCRSCPLFRRCGQHAMTYALRGPAGDD